MNEEKRKILDKINELIDKRKIELLQRFPSIHEIDDGFIIRFFTNWDNCGTNKNVRYKKIVDSENPDTLTVFHFIPKGTIFKLEERECAKIIICMSGSLDLDFNGVVKRIKSFSKTYLESTEFSGIALEDTYILTSNK